MILGNLDTFAQLSQLVGHAESGGKFTDGGGWPRQLGRQLTLLDLDVARREEAALVAHAQFGARVHSATAEHQRKYASFVQLDRCRQGQAVEQVRVAHTAS